MTQHSVNIGCLIIGLNDYVVIQFGTVGTQVARVEKLDQFAGRTTLWLRIWRHNSRRWTKTLRRCDVGAVKGIALSDDPRRVEAEQTRRTSG